MTSSEQDALKTQANIEKFLFDQNNFDDPFAKIEAYPLVVGASIGTS